MLANRSYVKVWVWIQFHRFKTVASMKNRVENQSQTSENWFSLAIASIHLIDCVRAHWLHLIIYLYSACKIKKKTETSPKSAANRRCGKNGSIFVFVFVVFLRIITYHISTSTSTSHLYPTNSVSMSQQEQQLEFKTHFARQKDRKTERERENKTREKKKNVAFKNS